MIECIISLKVIWQRKITFKKNGKEISSLLQSTLCLIFNKSDEIGKVICLIYILGNLKFIKRKNIKQTKKIDIL